ncbi:glycosyltransferase family 2 protein [Psychroflexus sp. CAK57W]|uniref:glycosyltransferase family 2 protein n=1 Tax=Psychroflexus curvus TaxID=2873595 RepID=UPI001CCA1F93|nr:glycosyltransferase family 2 protein [Psychroflexus curvus]MBZ9787847.1 glycosyltransferase family 2 protein [Psychroflexus curvus]
MLSQSKLISIIIPTYNRAHLISETLDSVLAQTYQNWECIIVDDGSSDNTDEVVDVYLRKDSRFKYYHRPEEHLPGGNGARNFGFKMSQGEYVNWFDDDDLMLSEKLKLKVKAIEENKVDIAISNTLNFHTDGSTSRPYKLDYTIPVNPENYISQRIGWITNDAFIKKKIIKISFNEKLKSGQEYNFFSRLLFLKPKVFYIKKDLSQRRIHNKGIQEKLKVNETKKKKELIFNEIELMADVYDSINDKIKNRFLKRIFRFSTETTASHKLPAYYFQINRFFIKKHLINISLYYNTWVFLNLITGRGYFVFKKYIKNHE